MPVVIQESNYKTQCLGTDFEKEEWGKNLVKAFTQMISDAPKIAAC